jgi:hypothetical protein
MTTKENKTQGGTPFEVYSAVGFDAGYESAKALRKLKKLSELEHARQVTVNYLLEMANLTRNPRKAFAYRAVYLCLRFVEENHRWFFKEESISDYLNGRSQPGRDAWEDPGILRDHRQAARNAIDFVRTDEEQ